MSTFQKSVHCLTCGKNVMGVDPELGIVVRAMVQCPESLEVPVCINCRRPLGEDDQRFVYAAITIRVGPFCIECDGALQIARAACSP